MLTIVTVIGWKMEIGAARSGVCLGGRVRRQVQPVSNATAINVVIVLTSVQIGLLPTVDVRTAHGNSIWGPVVHKNLRHQLFFDVVSSTAACVVTLLILVPAGKWRVWA